MSDNGQQLLPVRVGYGFVLLGGLATVMVFAASFYFPFVFLFDIGKLPAATFSLSYAIRDQRTIDIGKSNKVLSILFENLCRFAVGLLRAPTISPEISTHSLILD